MWSGRSRGRSVFWAKCTNHQPGRSTLENSEQHEKNKTELHSVGKWGCQALSVGVGGKKINTLSTSPDMWLLSLGYLWKQNKQWNKDLCLYVGESVTCTMVWCSFSVPSMECYGYFLFCLKRKSKIKSCLVRQPAKSSNPSLWL